MKKNIFVRILLNISMLILALFCVLPLWFVFTMSTMDSGTLFTKLPLLPGNQIIQNYKELTSVYHIWRGFRNSLVVAGSSTLMTLFFSTLAGYAYAKFRFKGKEILFGIMFITTFIPGQLAWVGFVQEMKAVKLLDTWWPLILPSLGSSFCIFVMRGYINSSIPDELVESARLDGCGEMRIFWIIIVPLVMPMLASLGILTFMGSWNNYSGALVVLFSSKKYTLPIVISTIRGLKNVDYPLMSMGVLISILPVFVVFLFGSKWIIASLTTGAVKG